MLASEVLRVFDINWINILSGLVWLFIFIGLYTSLVIGYSRISAVETFKRKTMPDLYSGKLKIIKEENRLLKEENRQLRFDNQICFDNMRVIRKSIGV